MRAALRLLRRWRRDRRANMAMMTALLAIPLLGFAGLAIDIGSATSARASLDAAADTAALLATTVASNQYMAGVSSPAAAGQAAAVQRFNAQAGVIASVSVAPVTVSVVQSGTQFTSTVTYSGLYKTMIAPVVGINTIPLGGTSKASLSVNPYVDIQVLMDVSASMLIAATPSDISAMQALTAAFVPTGILPSNVTKGEACAFACHWSAGTGDYLGLAQSKGVTLRLDVLRSAVGNLITNIASLNKQGSFRLGLSTFAQAFTQISPVSSNISLASSALTLIAPDINACVGNGCAETYFTAAMASLGGVIGTSGSGASQATSQKFLFIVTDGLVDQVVGGVRVPAAPVNPADCATIKGQGVTILTLYTPYIPLRPPPDGYTSPANPFYNQYVWPLQSMGAPDSIQQGLAACASSPSLAYVATNSAQIDAQLQTMLASVLQTSGHFTQ